MSTFDEMNYEELNVRRNGDYAPVNNGYDKLLLKLKLAELKNRNKSYEDMSANDAN